MMKAICLVALAACHGHAARGTIAPLRPACEAGSYWTGSACAPRGDAAAKLAAGKTALANLDVDQARAALDAVERSGPLDHATHVTLWEQRGIAAAYLEDEPAAVAAFDMLLSLDPGHFLSYTLSPKATFVFEKVRNQLATRGAPALEVNWQQGGKVGDPVPLDIEVVADPKQFLHRATVFVRTRGEQTWRAADLPLSQDRVVLPPVTAARPVSLELYLRAYDERGNEVLAWSDPARPREIPLRYDPPTPWYRKWWVYALGGTALALGTGAVVYAVTLAPPDNVSDVTTSVR
jgi:hypothetical protein